MVTTFILASTGAPTVTDADAALAAACAFDVDPRGSPRAVASAAVETVPSPPAQTIASAVDPFPGHTYGNLKGGACLAALSERSIPFARLGYARGVDTPVWVTGALRGITFRGESVDGATSARREVLDCRLVLALDDLAARLVDHGVTEVLHLGIYRGDVPLRPHERPMHHLSGLAIDVAAFIKDDGTRLDVRRDFHGRVGAQTCGARSQLPGDATGGTAELRGILCDLAAEKTFHQILTPNHDARHRDHFHLEVMRGTTWTLVE